MLTFKEFIKKYPPSPKFEKIQAEVRTNLYPDFDDLTKKEYDTVFNYTKDSSKLNGSLWSAKNGKSISKQMLNSIKTLNSTLTELPTQHDKLVVYSGVRRPSNPEQWIEQGGIVNIPSYLSTSLSPRLASTYVDYFLNSKDDSQKDKIGDLLIITIKPNQNIGGYVQDISHSPEDQEFLIKCNFCLKIIDTEPQIFNLTFDSGKVKLRTWNAVILDEKEIPDGDEKESYFRLKKELT